MLYHVCFMWCLRSDSEPCTQANHAPARTQGFSGWPPKGWDKGVRLCCPASQVLLTSHDPSSKEGSCWGQQPLSSSTQGGRSSWVSGFLGQPRLHRVRPFQKITKPQDLPYKFFVFVCVRACACFQISCKIIAPKVLEMLHSSPVLYLYMQGPSTTRQKKKVLLVEVGSRSRQDSKQHFNLSDDSTFIIPAQPEARVLIQIQGQPGLYSETLSLKNKLLYFWHQNYTV